jgi:phage tail-like protein
VNATTRGTTVGVPITQPLIQRLPSLYQDGMFLEQFTAGLDVVLAPIIATLDCLDAYVDPEVAPPDFVGWLGDWVGLRLDEDWTVERRRRLVAAAAELFAARGTGHGLADEIELYTGGAAEIQDPGRVWTSALPTGDEERRNRRSADRTVRVTVDVTNAGDVNWPALQALIRDAVPAHLPVEIELRETSTPKRRGKRKDGDVERSESS